MYLVTKSSIPILFYSYNVMMQDRVAVTFVREAISKIVSFVKEGEEKGNLPFDNDPNQLWQRVWVAFATRNTPPGKAVFARQQFILSCTFYQSQVWEAQIPTNISRSIFISIILYWNTIIHRPNMSKSIIIPMESHYPFGKIDPVPPTIPIKVKRKITSAILKQAPQKLLQKIKYFRGLKHDCLIKIDSVMEEDDDLFVSYEYVPIPIDKWFMGVHREFIENYQQRLILLSRYLVDQNIVTNFKKENLGLMENGEGKYFLDCLNFQIDQSIDKITLKRKCKQEIKAMFQFYIDKKNQSENKGKQAHKPQQKKQNNKMLKILEAIEKGKANLYGDSDQSKQAATLKQIKNQSQTSKVSQQKPFTQMTKAQLKQQFGPQSKKNALLDQKLNRFEQIKQKEYKSMKTSGQFYVQDFISVLQDQKTTTNSRPLSPAAQEIDAKAQCSSNPGGKATSHMHKQNSVNYTPNEKDQLNYSHYMEREALNLSATNISQIDKNNRSFTYQESGGHFKGSKDLNITQLGNSTLELQKKVSEAIANSLNAINKFKKAKG